MVKKYGLTLGGLQQKILNLILIFLLAIIALFGAVSFYQSKTLADVVSKASDEQQGSIERVSGETMQQVIESSMVKTNALQAYIADDMFSEMKTDVLTLQTFAEGLFAHQDSLEPYSYYPPDKANDGEFSAQVLWGEGVDYEHSEYLGVAAHMSDTMIAMCKNSGYLSNVFIGLSDGTLLCVDDQSANKFDENGIMQKGVIIRHLVLPLNLIQTRKIFEWIKDNLPDNVIISLMSQYIPLGKASEYKEINRRITKREYDKALDMFYEFGFEKGFMQELSSSKEDFIPPFNLDGV